MDNNSSTEIDLPVDNVTNTIQKMKDDLEGVNGVDLNNVECNKIDGNNTQNGSHNSAETISNGVAGTNGSCPDGKNHKEKIDGEVDNASQQTGKCDIVDGDQDHPDSKESTEEMQLASDTEDESTDYSTNSTSSDDDDISLEADELSAKECPKRSSSDVSAGTSNQINEDVSKEDKGELEGDSVQQRKKRIRRKNLELLNLRIEGETSKGSSGEEGNVELKGKLRRRSHRISDDMDEVRETALQVKRKRKSAHDPGVSEFICDEDLDVPKRKKRKPIKTPSDTVKSPRKPRNGSLDTDGRSATREENRIAKNLYRPNVSYHELKRTREVFIQYKKCIDFNTKGKKIKVSVCLDCKQQLTGVGKITIEKCRFYGFRKLKVTPKCTLSCGLSDPYTDPAEEDKDLWRPLKKPNITQEDVDTAKFIVSFVGDQFCDLALGENSTVSLKEDEDDPVVWKRTVKSLREMCDVCSTTLFHYQWICEKCGFVACKDCYHSRLIKEVKRVKHGDPEYDEYMWRKCSANKFNKLSSHILEDLLLAQVIVGDELTRLYTLFHKIRHESQIAQSCGCPEALKYTDAPPPVSAANVPIPQSAIQEKNVNEDSNSDDSSGDEGVDPDFLELFGSASEKTANETPASNSTKDSSTVVSEKKEVLSQMGKFNVQRPLSHPRHHLDTQVQYPTVKHSWMCNGKLLRLLEPSNPDNCKLFQEVWRCGQPVLISHVDLKLDKSLWTPQSFSNDFGKMKGVFINCMTGKLVMNQLMKVFWDGFEVVPNRLEDERGNTMLLKLKDWPEKADFADVLPSRFKDLMGALPLQDYTSREGRFNLASYLPDKFVKPDLGPKMYVAYGSGLHLEKGTTNLHLDISDAVNVMVYIGEPSDTPENMKIHRDAVIEAIKDSDCDDITIRRVIEGKDIPGALWHIYEARDADIIRNFLNENKVRQGIRPEERADPIHDQSCYLDKKLRKDLMNRYNIRGYPIIQCAGDSIFIPAGAPHQVRNLQNCIKVAEDFVSPENVHHCFKLTEEFRKLSESHSNHEDKLQIKNIVYHSIKDSVAVLLKEDPSNENKSAANNQPANMEIDGPEIKENATAPAATLNV